MLSNRKIDFCEKIATTISFNKAYFCPYKQSIRIYFLWGKKEFYW